MFLFIDLTVFMLNLIQSYVHEKCLESQREKDDVTVIVMAVVLYKIVRNAWGNRATAGKVHTDESLRSWHRIEHPIASSLIKLVSSNELPRPSEYDKDG